MSYQIESEIRRIAQEVTRDHPMVLHLQTQIFEIQRTLLNHPPENPLKALVKK